MLGAILAGASVLQGAFSLMEGASKAAHYKQQQLEAIRTSQINAANAEKVGFLNAQRLRYKNRLLLGSQIAHIAGSGFTMSGSNSEILAMNSYQLSQDVHYTLLNANEKAKEIRREGYSKGIQYGNLGSEAKLAAIGSLVNIAASAASAGYINHKADVLSQTKMSNSQKIFSNSQQIRQNENQAIYGF